MSEIERIYTYFEDQFKQQLEATRDKRTRDALRACVRRCRHVVAEQRARVAAQQRVPVLVSHGGSTAVIVAGSTAAPGTVRAVAGCTADRAGACTAAPVPFDCLKSSRLHSSIGRVGRSPSPLNIIARIIGLWGCQGNGRF